MTERGAKKRVVVIDDSPIILKLCSGTLQAVGYSVATFESPGDIDLEALGAPDLFLIDINLSEFFGDDVVDYIKDNWNVDAPIVLFSNIDEAELQQRAQSCGADGFISKNWGPERMVDCVREILGEPEPSSA